MKNIFIKFICLMLIIGLNWFGLLAVGQTIAYFNDVEISSENIFTAGVLDLTARSGQGNFVPGAEEMSPGEQVNRDIYIGKTAASLPLKHRVSYELIDGDEDFCDQLDLKIWYDHYTCQGSYADCRDMRLTYNGKLSLLNEYTNPDFEIPHSDDQFDIEPSDGTEQWFYYSIIVPNDIDDSFQGEVCNFKFVFEGWQDNVVNYDDGGFSDVEEIESVIKTGYWNPPVVLNEFLPNADNYPEFIEIYNKTGSSIDLDGFYIKADGNTIPINSATTALYSGGSTTIPASPNGWLVVVPTETDVINNSAGTITLYNPNNIIIDSYTYGPPEHNINNNPGWTNNLVAYLPLDNDTQDLSGNNNHGVNNGAVLTTGKINKGLSFDGINDYVFVSNSASLNGMSGDITLSAWVKFDTFGSGVNSRILSKDNGNNDWQLRLTDNKATFQIDAGGWNSVSGSTVLAIDVWYHLVGVYDGSYIRIYVNGTEDGQVSETDSFSGSTDNLYIGRNEYPVGEYVDGIIDEVKIYDRALDAAEILEHYNDVGVFGEVPVDKSYARIPDGIGAWVDPIPTPGGVNILESDVDIVSFGVTVTAEETIDEDFVELVSESEEEELPPTEEIFGVETEEKESAELVEDATEDTEEELEEGTDEIVEDIIQVIEDVIEDIIQETEVDEILDGDVEEGEIVVVEEAGEVEVAEEVTVEEIEVIEEVTEEITEEVVEEIAEVVVEEMVEEETIEETIEETVEEIIEEVVEEVIQEEVVVDEETLEGTNDENNKDE